MAKIPADFDSTEFKRRVWTFQDTEFYRAYDDTFKQTGFFDYTLTEFDSFKQWVFGDFLEVGCASGMTLQAVKKQCDVKRCVGVDVSLYALCRALNVEGVEVYWADAEKGLPFRDGEFNTVLAGHLLEHLRTPERALKELFRVSRNQVIIVVPLQSRLEGDKRTNLHIQFYPSIESFEELFSVKAQNKLVLRDGSLAVMRFKT